MLVLYLNFYFYFLTHSCVLLKGAVDLFHRKKSFFPQSEKNQNPKMKNKKVDFGF